MTLLTRLIQSAKEVAAELDGLFDSDRDPPADGAAPLSAVDLARSWK